MFLQKKPATEKVTYETVKKKLDALIGEADGQLKPYLVVDLLESRAHSIRCREATRYSVVPRMHSGNI
jgi:hypothetical protein